MIPQTQVIHDLLLQFMLTSGLPGQFQWRQYSSRVFDSAGYSGNTGSHHQLILQQLMLSSVFPCQFAAVWSYLRVLPRASPDIKENFRDA